MVSFSQLMKLFSYSGARNIISPVNTPLLTGSGVCFLKHVEILGFVTVYLPCHVYLTSRQSESI